jgi:hypothetical protein
MVAKEEFLHNRYLRRDWPDSTNKPSRKMLLQRGKHQMKQGKTPNEATQERGKSAGSYTQETRKEKTSKVAGQCQKQGK